MKKQILIITLFLLTLVSCTKEDSIKTTFQVFNEQSMNLNITEPLYNGCLYEVIVYGLDSDNKVVNEYYLDNIGSRRMSREIDLDNQVVRIEVTFKLIPPESRFYNTAANIRMRMPISLTIIPGGNSLVIVNAVNLPSLSVPIELS